LVSDADATRCCFEERPGPGPQLEDFGEFDSVVSMTPEEMKL
jgi:hypothetical protein